MDFLHTRAYPISRGQGGSAVAGSAYRSGSSVVAAAAYRSSDKLKRDEDGQTHDYSRKHGVVHAEILLPKNAPASFQDRSTLWNEVERIENRINSRLANQWEAGLPKEFSQQDQIELARNFAKSHFVDKGMVVDLAIHDKDGTNPHAHFLMTTRGVTPEGFEKNKYSAREWVNRKSAGEWRNSWANECNQIYERMGLTERIDPRKYSEQGRLEKPTKTLGKYNHQLEKRGIRTKIGDENRAITSYNESIRAQIKEQKMQLELEHQPKIPTPNNPIVLYDSKKQPEKEKENTVSPVEVSKQDEINLPAMSGIELRQLKAQIADLKESQKFIADYDKQLKELEGQRQIKSSQNTDRDIEQIRSSRNDAYQNLKNTWQIEPDQISNRLKEMELKRDSASVPATQNSLKQEPQDKSRSPDITPQVDTPTKTRSPDISNSPSIDR